MLYPYLSGNGTMKTDITPSNRKRRGLSSKASTFLVGILAAMASLPSPAAVDISQSPLYIGSNVPGNLALVPSVEFPTVVSVANRGNYSMAGSSVGYFDPRKCYNYHYSATESERHFYPVSMAAANVCAGAQEWSGSFLNWATMQTIDPFRSALTGGYRVKDEVAETWLEKAWGVQGGTGNFPHRSITTASIVADSTPAQWGAIRMRIIGLGNKLRFGNNSGNVEGGTNLIAYDPASHPLDNAAVSIGANNIPGGDVAYEVSVRVKVCDPSVGLESNCVKYGSNYKPEGLIQEYSSKILYSAFSYQNVDGQDLDGGVLRANAKFVGPQSYYPESGPQANPAREWDPATGILYQNPDAADAAATSARVTAGGACAVTGGCVIRNSGVINYLNKFGQMNTGKNVKSQDNVSELYYTAIRYFKHLGDVPAYSVLSGNATNRYQRADGFPIITNWNEVVAGKRIRDPIRYQCQTNVILGIGDTNTWQDKNLPSASATSATAEPNPKPQEVRDDNTVDVIEMMTKIWQMEMGWTEAAARTRASRDHFNNAGHHNSAYIAALAYDSRTRDIRPETRPNGFPNKQTISTHWVDVIEGGTDNDYKNTETNQYYLAGKYGGFAVPEGFDPDTRTAALPQAWWSTGDMTPRFMRPNNFYAASDATKMVESLTNAFSRIVAEMVGSGSSFAANTTKLEAGAMTFQAQFYGGTWGGELNAYTVNPATGALTTAWNATAHFPVNYTDRKIYFGSGASTLSLVAHGSMAGTPLATATANEINYLRGDRSQELANGAGLRQRRSVLGDIVNSQPVYVGTPNGQLYRGATFTGASGYPAFVAAKAAANRSPVVYVGANDGMLHAFNASTGAEVFAFMPKGAMAGLIGVNGFTSPDYQHRYFVDGDLTVADVFQGGSWKTILVGTLGRGGRSIFALDVTDPAAPTLLWEKDATDIPELGNNLNKPIIAQVADGDWRVLLGNGPNSSNDHAQLITVAVGTGNTTTIDTGVGGDNGLSGINAWASSSSGFVDTVYAGDLKGNVWKMTGIATTGVADLLFDAGTSQPITATPLVSKNPATGDTWVFIGTGRYLNDADVSNNDVQSWYGLIDKGALPINKANLRETEILAEVKPAGSNALRVIQSYGSSGVSGWYMDLVSPAAAGGARGERMVVSNFFQGFALVGTTRIPDSDDVCSPSGVGFTMSIDPFTGGRLAQSFFDVNGDGVFDDKDMVEVDGVKVPVSGLGHSSSPINSIFLGDVMYTTYDDGTSGKIKTNSGVMNARRVSWRELIRD